MRLGGSPSLGKLILDAVKARRMLMMDGLSISPCRKHSGMSVQKLSSIRNMQICSHVPHASQRLQSTLTMLWASRELLHTRQWHGSRCTCEPTVRHKQGAKGCKALKIRYHQCSGCRSIWPTSWNESGCSNLKACPGKWIAIIVLFTGD